MPLNMKTLPALLSLLSAPDTSVLAEVRTNDRKQGELRIRFDSDVFDTSLPRQDESTTSVKLGVRHDLSLHRA